MSENAQGGSDLNMAPNVAGLLCYVPCCVGFIFSIVAAIVEKRSRFVRFHAFQSLLLHGGMIAIGIGLSVAQAIAAAIFAPLALIVALIGPLVGLALLGLLIFMMIKANGGEEMPLPVIGDLAKGWL